MKRFRTYVRHYCSSCGSRIFPFDKYDSDVIVPGKRKDQVLLTSTNADDPDHRKAWCWSCNRMSACKRETEAEFLRRYIARRGIVTRERHPRRKWRSA